jgi:cytochrome c peroxidase
MPGKSIYEQTKKEAQMSVKKTLMLIFALSLFASLFGCSREPTAPFDANSVGRKVPSGEITTMAELGKAFFFDENLSQPNKMSCATCHSPSSGFAEPNNILPVSKGALPLRYGNRNAQSVAYAAFSPAPYFDPVMRPGMMGGLEIGGQFWDGRAANLIEQAKGPFLNPLEMHNLDKKQVIQAIRQSSYAAAFKEIFGAESLSEKNIESAYEHVAEAIAEYEKTSEVSPFSSKFDYSLKGEASLTEQEAKGYHLFTGKANCVKCHAIKPTTALDPEKEYLFTNFAYQNTGVPKNPANPFYTMPSPLNPAGSNYVDLGRGAITGNSMDNGKFKIPSLRNVAVTSPYMHNGYFNSIKEVVMFYNTRDEPTANWPPPEVNQNVHRHMPPMDGTLGRLKLSNDEVDAIVAFLNTLTDGYQ